MESTLEQLSVENETFIKSLRKKSPKLYVTKSGKPRTKLNHKDIYQRNIFEICLRLHSSIDTLYLSRFFLEENLKSRNSIDKFNNGNILRYHIEYFFIKITTYKDLIFKLINKIYDFDIEENIGLERKVRTQIKTRNLSEAVKLLEGLDLIMEKIIPIRNEIAHGGYLNDIDLILIESMNVTKQTDNDEYEKVIKRFNFNSTISMYQIELMLSAYLILIYKELLSTRRLIEKQKTTHNTDSRCTTPIF